VAYLQVSPLGGSRDETACTWNKKAFCVLEFAETDSVVTVERRFRTVYHTEPPMDKTILVWYMKFQLRGCLYTAKRAVRPRTLAKTVDLVGESFVRSPQKWVHCASREFRCLSQVFGAFFANVFVWEDTSCRRWRRWILRITVFVFTSAWISSSSYRKTCLLRSWFSMTKQRFMYVVRWTITTYTFWAQKILMQRWNTSMIRP